MALSIASVVTPIGPLHLGASDDGLVAVRFALDRDDHHAHPGADSVANPRHPVLALAISELEAWFAGTLTTFTVPLAPIGTPFQLAVWRALVKIPYGERRSYEDVAVALGKPHAVRAVGGANGRNPIAIVVPCHRVLGKDGRLVGYGGGLDTKRWLLAHEAKFVSFRLEA